MKEYVLYFDNNNKARGNGIIRLKITDNSEFLLCNLRHVLQIKPNLLYISMLDDLGCCTRI